mgnify:CR=1 FL=1
MNPDSAVPGSVHIEWVLRTVMLQLMVIIAVARRASYPQALMKPYRKGER